MRAWLRRWLGIDDLSVRVASLRPDDVVIVELSGGRSEDAMRNVQHIARDVWPNNRVLVVDAETSIRIMRPDALLDRDEEPVEV